jgi:hypothetical protein
LCFAAPAGRGRRGTEGFAAVEVLSPKGELREAAANLFSALHRLERAGLDVILAEPVPEIGLGRAIMDRLRRAATPPPARAPSRTAADKRSVG